MLSSSLSYHHHRRPLTISSPPSCRRADDRAELRELLHLPLRPHQHRHHRRLQELQGVRRSHSGQVCHLFSISDPISSSTYLHRALCSCVTAATASSCRPAGSSAPGTARRSTSFSAAPRSPSSRPPRQQGEEKQDLNSFVLAE